mgnify:FL=1
MTGASSGIGRATALRLARTGWAVLAVARRADRLDRLEGWAGAGAPPGTIVPVVADLTEQVDVDAVLEAVRRQGGVDTLVNIAGGARGVDSVAEARAEDWDWMFQVNVMATLRLTQALLPTLRAHGLSLIHI